MNAQDVESKTEEEKDPGEKLPQDSAQPSVVQGLSSSGRNWNVPELNYFPNSVCEWLALLY